MPAYDLYLPLGEFCLTSGNLRSLRLQFESFPFDWVFTTTANVIHLLKTDCTDLLNLQTLKFSCTAEKHDRYIDTVSNVEFVHDFPTGEDVALYVDQVKTKYQQRVQRMHKRLADAKSIMFVIASMNDVSTEDYLNYMEQLRQIYPQKHISLTVVTLYRRPGKDIEMATEIVNPGLRRFRFYMPDVNNWHLLRKYYENIFKSYRLTWRRRLAHTGPDIWFRTKKTLLKAAAALMPIPSWRQKIKQKTKRKFFE